MLPELLQRASLYHLLYQIDLDFAASIRRDKCPYCGAALHQANYERKPRGGPDALPEKLMIRRSFCCSRKGCRRRVLPPSCLFMGRRVYWGIVILIVITLRQNRPRGASFGKLQKIFNISKKTIKRWTVYYRAFFAADPQWQKLRHKLPCLIKKDELPGALVQYYCRSSGLQAGIIACLKWLATVSPEHGM